MDHHSVELQLRLPETIKRMDAFTAQLIIRSCCGQPLEGLTLRLTLPQTLALRSGETVRTLDPLMPGTAAGLPLELLALAGGRRMLSVSLECADFRHMWQFPVDISGRGVYSGDNHTHSTYSDGSASPEENAAGAYRNWNNSWIIFSEHNNDAQKALLPEIAAQYNGNFLPLSATEITTGYIYHNPPTPSGEKRGHALAYAYPGLPRLVIDGPDGAFTWQSSIDHVMQSGGMFFIAHPYDQTYPFETPERWRDYTGIVVWNGSAHALAEANQRSFALWDRRNMLGGRHYSGIAGTDGHSARRVGSLFTRAELEALTPAEVRSALENCRCCGSNGPDLHLRINGASLGQTVRLAGPGMVRIEYEAFSPYADLTLLRILSCPVTGKDEDPVPHRRTVFSLSLDGGWVHGAVCVPVDTPTFFRMEVTSRRSFRSGTPICPEADTGFAFTNPIWVELDGTEPEAFTPELFYGGEPLDITPERYRVRSISVGGSFDPALLTVKNAAFSVCFTPVSGETLEGLLELTVSVGTRSVRETLLVRHK